MNRSALRVVFVLVALAWLGFTVLDLLSSVLLWLNDVHEVNYAINDLKNGNSVDRLKLRTPR